MAKETRDRITSNQAKWESFLETQKTGWVWKKNGEKWMRDLREIYEKWVTSKQRSRQPVRVCIPLAIKVSGASYFSSAAADMRRSSAPFPALAPGEFITSPLPATVQPRSSKNKCSAVFFSGVCENWTCFFFYCLLLSWYDRFYITTLMQKS